MNYYRLKDKSLKIKQGKYVIHNLKMATPQELEKQQMAAYKDFFYRSNIAARYKMGLVVNDSNFITPFMCNDVKVREKSLFEEYKEEMRSEANA